MALTNDIRNTLTNPTPLYFAAGVVDKLRAEAPERIAAVRSTDPKELQEKVTAQAQETRIRVSETLSGIDTDVKRLREQAQTFAMQGVGVAAEYAVKARETYDELAERGRGAVRDWRGDSDEEPEVRVERAPVRVAEPPVADGRASSTASKPASTKANGSKANGTRANGTTPGSAGQRARTEPTSKGTTAKKTATAKSTTAKKTSTAKSTAAGGSRKSGSNGVGGTSGAAGTSSANGTGAKPRKPSAGSDG